MPMKILITGGAGYLGSVLTPHLLSLGHRVPFSTTSRTARRRCWTAATTQTSTSFMATRGTNACFNHSFRKRTASCRLRRWWARHRASKDQIGATTVNRNAIMMISRMRSKSQRLLFPTTNSGYGIGQPGVACTEETALRPISLYATTKVEAERALLDSGEAVTYRLATVFGASPRMRLDLLVNDFVYRAVNDRAIVLFEAHFKRNYIHIRDVARVFSHGIDKYESMKGHPYNVGLSDANLSKLELCERIKRFIPEFVFSESKVGEDPDKRNYIVSNARIEASGWKPSHSLDDGIAELIKAYKIVKQRQHGNF